YEFTEWRKMILDLYRGPCPKHGPVRFVDEKYVLDFVDDCQAMIDAVFDRACAIWNGSAGA
ncbi:MAG: hypothetical protein IKN05_03680, partial [Clostridia bacterium]|nr:hypothetical protein [Clostridia bacterium]